MNISVPSIISVTELRKNFGTFWDDLVSKSDSVVVIRDGKPIATVTPHFQAKKKALLKAMSEAANSEIGTEEFWKGIPKRQNRKEPIDLGL